MVHLQKKCRIRLIKNSFDDNDCRNALFFVGGYLNDTNEFTFNWYSAWFFEAAFYVAVNCFVLISGFCMYVYYT